MNEESYFKQYKLLNTNATDYVAFDITKPYLDFGEIITITRTIESYERNNEEIPLIGDYAVLTNPKDIPIAIGKLEKVNVVIPNVEITIKVCFV